MIDEVTHEMGDSLERWRDEAKARDRRSRERRAAEAKNRLLPRTWLEWGTVLAIVLFLFVFFALLGAAAGVDLNRPTS